MRVLLIDTDTCGLDFAYRCVEAGHDVRWYEKDTDGKTTTAGNGFPGIEKVADWRSCMKWAKDGLVWTSSNCKFLDELDQWKRHGYAIFAPSKAAAELEINRNSGMKLLEKCGVPVPPYRMFDGLESARAAAMKADQPYVFKTMGDNADKSLSYVAKTPADLVGRIDRWIKEGINIKGAVMLQEKIDGVEMGCSVWFGPDGYLPDRYNINFEHKKLMPGNYGPNTGEMGTVVQYTMDDRIAEIWTDDLVKALVKLGQLGDTDLNCMIDTKGKVWPLEFTCRPGWPFDWIDSELRQGDPVEWMRDLVRGEDTLKVSDKVAVGEIVAVPPFPYDVKEIDPKGLPIETPDDWRGIHPVCMEIAKGPAMDGNKVIETGIYKTSGDYVMCCVGTGKTVKAAKKACDKIIDGVQVANMIVRNDIGEGLEQVLPKLHKLGFAQSMEYDE